VHGSLSMCVEAAIARAHYPVSKQMLFVEVQVYWGTPGIVRTSARVTGYREAPKGALDIDE
jgi:hypothetical protein